ncbi:hypothetical protein P9E76_06950 [Schinkia azotoformans]|uniref:Uncharacterized protein n=1 Tax=Schinkia azotoformans LMG 9581 TaxID=1131731 RepID=K6CWH5_SCHAZ|nr:hypothetical protein [Schinkia azotoformans]EKN64577.1 hypothetical protein BAZO_13239 [Schinkia azotoformans LMG 9581]MEC1637885.1 hypothetical protein [Schinkia azotoformans]MEC1944781.1 hypothetical protein [Schinkia azotoformans]
MKFLKPSDILSGNTFSYLEVFNVTDGLALGTKEKGVLYYIEDLYCMNPSCKCNDVVLIYTENKEIESEKGAHYAVRLSLKKKNFEILDTNGVTKKEVEDLIKNSMKNNNEAIEFYKKLYLEMKEAGKKVLHGGNSDDNNITESSQKTLKEQLRELQSSSIIWIIEVV